MRSLSRFLALPLLALACAKPRPAVPPSPGPGDGCATILAEHAADPAKQPVDRVAEPVRMTPAFIRRPIPQSVLRATHGKRIEVAVSVVVDTLGKPDMRTWKVVKSTHPWFGTNAKASVAKWTFTPAEIKGCKVARPWTFTAKAG